MSRFPARRPLIARFFTVRSVPTLPAIPLASLALAILLGAFAPAAWAACGCSQMAVTSANGTTTICSNNTGAGIAECQRAAGGGGTACPNNTYVFTCPTGVNSQMALSQKTGFKVAATYAANSTASDCIPGQILQETITSNGSQEANPKINPTTLTGDQTIGGLDLRINNNGSQSYPRIDQTYGSTTRQFYGGDNYVAGANNVIASQSNAGATWWDNPDQTKDIASENATWHFRFISFVRGSAGQASCSCAFDIKVSWPSNGAATTTMARAASGNQNCP